LPGLSKSVELDDIYGLSAAFRTDGEPRLTIAGVARSPDRTWQLIRSPLKDDFAVLKIDRVPEGLHPLPLDKKLEALAVPKLSPVIALGFPLGSRTQEATVNVSVTQGHVRRAFENLLQVDTSIHRGNSGGPVIDIRGKVIGIASGVAMDWIAGPVPVPTLLSDMGMVLPINKAVEFLQELKAGESPEYVLTGRIALALWAEGSGNKNKAIDHYREALGSYMDDMIEYVFAVERIKRLRQKS
jgi:S1-C subfamily serine protease